MGEPHQGEHPRVCGENFYFEGWSNFRIGTSPRMRGKLFRELRNRGILRNIPAYAGKTLPLGHSPAQRPEHPRVCGENQLRCRGLFQRCGTSPRMRGKLTPKDTKIGDYRNIPAYAGKTKRGDITHGRESEHPRVCGENIG